MKKIKGKVIGIIVILIMCMSACASIPKNNRKAEAKLKHHEMAIQKSQGEDWKIHSETKIGDFVFSAAYSSEEIGIQVFQPNDISGTFFSTDADHISQIFRLDGTYYYLFWINRPDADYAEITYIIDGKEMESIKYDAKKIFYSQVPNSDYSFGITYYDKNGNAYEDIPNMEIEYLNQGAMIDGKVYWSTGEISGREHKGKTDGKIISSVSNMHSPSENDQSNFGVKGLFNTDHNYYMIDDSTVEIFMDENWVLFKTIWDIESSVDNVSPTGMNLIYTHSGKITESNFHTKGAFKIEQKTEAGWKELPLYAEVMWNDDEVYFIPENGSVTLPINWEGIYGKLKAGEYRIGKEIIWFDGENYLMRRYWAEFTVE